MAGRAPVVAVVGPTAVGKTALAVEIAQRFGGEIVNADSRQVYVGMDIGTAKPTAAEQQVARHHLIGIRTPAEPMSLGEYLLLAGDAIANIRARGKLPILCGGTGQYVWALLEGWRVPRVPPDPSYRAELEAQAEAAGGGALWRNLNLLDPARAAAVGPHNTRRIIRALEVLRASPDRVPATARADEPPYHSVIIGLTSDRQVLYDRIDARFDDMMDTGLMDEAVRLRDEGYALGEGPLSGVGYSELGAYLEGKMTLEEAIARSKNRTHRLVRRQYTWFKLSDQRINWLDATWRLPVAEAIRLVADFRSS